MTGVRVLAGTRKGAFILTSDAKRKRGDIAGPVFGFGAFVMMRRQMLGIRERAEQMARQTPAPIPTAAAAVTPRASGGTSR